MKLKTSIFLWVTTATLLPLVLLVLVVTSYSETRYQDDVARQAVSSLNGIVSEINRRLYYDRQVVLSLTNSQSMRDYMQVLDVLNKGKMHEKHFSLSQRLSRFLASFQGVVPGFKTIRILDKDNNTLIKITGGKVAIGSQEGIESSPFIEEDSGDKIVKKKLSEFPAKEVSFILMPQAQWDREDLRGPPMLNAVVPLVLEKKHVGYVVVGFSGNQIDSILELAPRIHRGSLIVAEINPDDKTRDGIVLYDDLQAIRFAKTNSAPMKLQLMAGGQLWEAVHNKPDGEFTGSGNLYRTFYHEHSPYLSRLVSWVVAIRIDLNEVRAPFNRIRLGVILMGVIALLISLFIARMGARTIARPVSHMADSLKQYADGDRDIRVNTKGSEEIQQLEWSFNYMADQVEKSQHMLLQSAKLASIGQMAAGIGHEINNPLNNIMSLAKLLLRSVPEGNERLKADLESLREGGKRATDIVRGILDFARQVPPQYSCFELIPWLEETVRLLQQAAKSKMIKLNLEADQAISINGDRGQLQQVLVNLVLNAIDASDSNSEVTIALEVDNDLDELVIKVIDQGSGLEPGTDDQIFDPFFTTKAEGEGTGLGLSISHGIVEHHQGSLVLENNELSGVTATIRLPM